MLAKAPVIMVVCRPPTSPTRTVTLAISPAAPASPMLYLRPGGRGERAPWRQPVRPMEMQGTRAAAKARNT